MSKAKGPEETSVSVELTNPLEMSQVEVGSDASSHRKVPTWKAVFLIFRSLVGIGVLTMPHAIQYFGYVGAMLFFPIFTWVILYVLDLVLRIANDLGFTGNSIEELIEKSGNGKWLKLFSLINNWMMISCGIANCIFAGKILYKFSDVSKLGFMSF